MYPVDNYDTDNQDETTGGDLVPVKKLITQQEEEEREKRKNTYSLVKEEYARLHNDVEAAAFPGECYVVGVTSSVYGEGKTTVALNLAATMAQNSESRVMLVDCNLRSWDMQDHLGMYTTVGLVDILEGIEDNLINAIRHTELDNLTVLPSGRASSNPGRLVRSPRLAEVVNTLRMSYDYVIVDMAPLLPVADTQAMLKLLDGLVMVVRAGVTPRDMVSRAVEMVSREKVLGVVLNGVQSSMPKWLQKYFS